MESSKQYLVFFQPIHRSRGYPYIVNLQTEVAFKVLTHYLWMCQKSLLCSMSRADTETTLSYFNLGCQLLSHWPLTAIQVPFSTFTLTPSSTAQRSSNIVLVEGTNHERSRYHASGATSYQRQQVPYSAMLSHRSIGHDLWICKSYHHPYIWFAKTSSKPTCSTVFVQTYKSRFDSSEAITVANDRYSSYAPQSWKPYAWCVKISQPSLQPVCIGI